MSERPSWPDSCEEFSLTNHMKVVIERFADRTEASLFNEAGDLIGHTEEDEKMSERIVAAAVIWNGLVISKRRPARHHDILQQLDKRLGIIGGDYQGFLTDQGEFVSRDIALTIAEEAGQVVAGKTVHRDQLFSEDVW